MESEKTTEAYLRDRVKALGGHSYKWVSPGCSGVPDRIVVRPDGGVFFVETKSEGETSTKQQKRRQAELREMGCRVYADIDTKVKVDEMLRREFGGRKIGDGGVQE